MTWVENATPEVDAQSQWQTILGVCLSLSVLSIAVVSTRLWIRYKARGLAADDYMSALSMIFALIYSILCIVRTSNLGDSLPRLNSLPSPCASFPLPLFAPDSSPTRVETLEGQVMFLSDRIAQRRSTALVSPLPFAQRQI